MERILANEHKAFVSTDVAGNLVIRGAWIAVAISALIFGVALPLARTAWVPIPAFIPSYTSCLIVCDLITAVLLFSQFSVVQTWGLLLLASGYLFTATITLGYALIFPGLVAPTGLFGAGPQTTSAMYMFWHAGFPLLVILYAALKATRIRLQASVARPRGRAYVAIVVAIAAVTLVVSGFVTFATAGGSSVPEFLVDNRTTPLGHAILLGDWILSLAALIVLIFRRPHTALDVWLMVVMCVWLFDLALSAILNTGRYDLGWYIGRIYGLLSASFLLMLFLVENASYYARLFRLSVELKDANEALERLSLYDSLTDLANRRYFDKYVADQVLGSNRHQRSLALVMFDVDYFKAFNDKLGHPEGDECLKAVAGAIRSCCRRPADLAARYGGEEFAIVLPDTDSLGAAQISEAVRKAVEALQIPHPNSLTASWVTVSGGIAVLQREKGESGEDLVQAADDALYHAKRAGRNRIS